MPDGFNMVTAMETIHRHIHAVGCVELFGVRDFGKAPLHRLCRMHGTGDVLRFGLRVVEGEALLEIGIDRRPAVQLAGFPGACGYVRRGG